MAWLSGLDDSARAPTPTTPVSGGGAMGAAEGVRSRPTSGPHPLAPLLVRRLQVSCFVVAHPE